MRGFQGLKAVGQWFSASRANGDAAKALEQIRNDIGPSLSLDQLIDTDKPKGSSSKSVESSGAVSTDVVYGQEQLPVLNAEYARIAGDLLTILRDNRGLSLHASAGFVATYLKLARQNMRKGVANYSAVARYLNLADQTNVQLYMENQLRARGHSVVFKLQLASTPTATTAADRLLEALAVFTVGRGHQQAAQVTQTVQLEMAAKKRKDASETEARQALVDALELLFQLQYGLHIRDNLLLPGLRMYGDSFSLPLLGLWLFPQCCCVLCQNRMAGPPPKPAPGTRPSPFDCACHSGARCCGWNNERTSFSAPRAWRIGDAARRFDEIVNEAIDRCPGCCHIRSPAQLEQPNRR